jgi:hypothetical protein
MDLAPNTPQLLQPTHEQVQAAELIVADYLLLESTPAWQRMREDLRRKRDSLATQVLDDASLSPEQRERVRFGYSTLKRALDDMEGDFNKALQILKLVGKLPTELRDRAPRIEFKAPEPQHEGVNPYGEVTADLNTLFGNVPPQPASES